MAAGSREQGCSAQKVETVIQALISKYCLKRQRPRVADLHRQVILECRKAKFPPPSYKAVWVRVNSVDPALTVRKREGAGVARDRFAPVKKGLAPKRPLELVQIDHTLADIMVVDEVERRSIGRPWLTLVIDVATRMILGHHLSLDAPSSTSVALALSHAILPKRLSLESKAISGSWPAAGLPETLHLDNAKEFHSNALKRGCREHGISLTYRPPQTSHFGGHIERLIGTMTGDLHLLPGTTFSSIRDRGEYKSAKMASLTMRELERWLTLQIVEIYHQRVHRSIKAPPIKVWEKALASGNVTIRHPADPPEVLYRLPSWGTSLDTAGRNTDVRYSLLGQCPQSIRRPLDRPESDSLRSTGPFACLYKSHSERPLSEGALQGHWPSAHYIE